MGGEGDKVGTSYQACYQVIMACVIQQQYIYTTVMTCPQTEPMLQPWLINKHIWCPSRTQCQRCITLLHVAINMSYYIHHYTRHVGCFKLTSCMGMAVQLHIAGLNAQAETWRLLRTCSTFVISAIRLTAALEISAGVLPASPASTNCIATHILDHMHLVLQLCLDWQGTFSLS